MDIFKARYISVCNELRIEPIQKVLNLNELVTSTGSKQQQKLDLSSIRITAKGVIALAESLREDHIFNEMNLCDCFLGDEGCSILCEALKSNKTITNLELRGNDIRSDGGSAIANLLRINQTITHLSLEWNSIGLWDNGIRALSDSIANNTTLLQLDLRNNRVGPQGGTSLALAFKRNKFLLRLDLRWNHIGVIGGRAIAEALKYNTSLIFLEVSGNEISEDSLQAIEVGLSRNRDISALKEDGQQKAIKLEKDLTRMKNEHTEFVRRLDGEHQTREEIITDEVKNLRSEVNQVTKRLIHSKEAYSSLEEKYTHEIHVRELTEIRVRELSDALATARKETSEALQQIHQELRHERELKTNMEETHRNAIDSRETTLTNTFTKLREAERKVDILTNERDNEKRIVDDLEVHIKKQHAEISSLRDELRSLRQSHLDHLAQATALAMKEVEGKIKNLESARSKAETESDQIRKEMILMKTQSDQTKMEIIAQKQGEMEAKEKLFKERERLFQKSADDAKSELSKIQIELVAVRREAQDYMANLERERDKNQELSREAFRIKSELDSLRNEKMHLSHALEVSQRNETALRQELDRHANKQEEAITSIIAQHKADVANKDLAIAAKQEEINSLDKKLRAKTKELELIHEEHKKQISGAELALDAHLRRTFGEIKKTTPPT